MADLLSTSVSGLLAFQSALDTTAHNIANANTPGYSRQRVDLATRPPEHYGFGYIGNGVQVADVRRLYDSFLAGQVRSSTSNNSRLQAFYGMASQIDNLLADPNAGLSPSLQAFFNAVQQVANAPSSIPARQAMLGAADTLANRFHSLDQSFTQLNGQVDTQMQSIVGEINSLAASIAKLNQSIVQAEASANGQPPNDLLDQRDQLINQLAQHVSVSTVAQSGGAVNVFIGSGQSLVLGQQASTLSVVPSPSDPARPEISYQNGASTVIVTNSLSGGDLGGLLDFRRQVLDPSWNALGQVATGLAQTFNAQHHLGQDLNGALGGDFFNVAAPQVIGNSANTGNAVVNASVTNVNALTTSDYRLSYDGSKYTLTRLSDGSATTFTSFPQTVDGVTLSLASGSMNAGDSFLIRPTRGAAQSFSVAIQDPTKIAAAAPIQTQASATNAGTGQISPGTVINTNNLPLTGNITLTFDPNALGPGVPGFTVSGGPGGTLAYNPATDANGKQFSFPSYGGITFTLSGVPASGDSFVISPNTNASNDNRNALLLAQLQTTPTLDGSTATYQDAYGQLVSQVGTVTQQAQTNSQAAQTQLNQATQAQQAVSGVNLDQEAANLVRYQQAYQAAAKTITVAETLFQSLLSAVGG